jgi:hypothetical protein
MSGLKSEPYFTIQHTLVNNGITAEPLYLGSTAIQLVRVFACATHLPTSVIICGARKRKVIGFFMFNN